MTTIVILNIILLLLFWGVFIVYINTAAERDSLARENEELQAMVLRLQVELESKLKGEWFNG